MNPTAKRARGRPEEILAEQELTAGLLVRVHGKHLSMMRAGSQ